MLRVIKKIILSSVSILGISFLFWIVFLLNPNLSYANKTQFGMVAVYHNNALDEQTEALIDAAIHIIKDSELYDNEISIQLCLNDDSIYPNLYPFAGGPMAYAMLNKTIVKNCKIQFDENVVETQWEVNNNELRTFNLTWLLAHEFMHNLQYHAKSNYVMTSTLGKINWKLEGHAEYISRQFKNDGKLKEKISKFLEEQKKEHNGLPVFELDDGTRQIFSYFKYALVIQYLIEEKEMDFNQICDDERNLDKLYSEMIEWVENKTN